jgi:hypothetical protein
MNHQPRDRRGARLRRLGVWVVATGVVGCLVPLLAPEVAAGPVGGPFAARLVWLCAAAGLAGAAWLWLLATAVAVEAVTGAGAASRVSLPGHRLVLAACGIALAGASPAAATPGAPHVDPHDAAAAVLLTGLPLPDRPVGDDAVVVRAGDTLWALAERALPPGADDGAVTARWHRIYHLNRDLIGPDPDLIQPGQRLRLPRP